MPKVYNWELNNQPPENPKASDMRYGIGYMNDILMEMTASMSSLLSKVGEHRDVDLSRLRERFENTTLGAQVGILRDNYDGIELVYTKMEELVLLRNHFIHEFRTSRMDDFKAEASSLSKLINLIRKIIGQLDNAKKRIDRSVSKSKNVKKNEMVTTIKSTVRKCRQYKSGRVSLTDLSQALPEKVKWDKKFYVFLEDIGIKTRLDEKNRKIRYVKLSDID